MLKFYLLAGLCCFWSLLTIAQTVTPVTINVTQLAQLEAEHPEMFGFCKTCAKKEEEENDNGWRELANDMPVPADAIIKRQVQDNLRPLNPAPNTPLAPLTPSPAPTQTFLGHVDPGNGIPPDTHGAVGPNHVVTATNNFLRIHSKTGSVISTISITTFAGVSNTCDPYIKFDPLSNRWFYSAIDCSGSDGNQVAVLVSQSSDPTGNWFRYTFVPNVPSGLFFLDHPYLGFDDRWVVISGRKFPGGNFDGPVIFLLDKTKLLASQPLTFGVDAQAIEKTGSDGDAPLPVSVFGSNPSPRTFYILQNWNGNSGGSGLIRLSTITGNIPNAVWNTAGTGAVFPASPQPWASTTGSVAEQLGETRRLATNDARISTGVMVNGNIWCAHHVGVSATNVAIQWWQLNGTPGAAFGSVLQRGRIGAGLNNNYRYFPGITVNSNEDVMIGYTVSSNTSRVSCGYSFRSNTTPPNTMNDEVVYKVGLSTYYKDFGGSRARWGDYSHSALDPTDGSLWTIQEYADQRVGNTDNDSRFGVWWAQVIPSSSLLQADAAIGAVIEPAAGLLCKQPVTPTVSIRNLGNDTLRTVKVGMILDNVSLGAAVTLSGLAVPTFGISAQQVITPSFSVTTGTHTLKIFTTEPNGGTDQRTSNDTTTVTFTVAPVLTLPYTENFASNPFPPANGSAVLNPDGPPDLANGTGLTWERTTAAGRPGPGCIRVNCFNYQTIGQRDIYRTPEINTSILDSLAITFNVAYQQYFGTDVPAPLNDSLRILYSQDCGVTWYPAGYAKGGASLSTVSATTNVSFVPTAAQWRQEKLVLKNLCPKNLGNIMIGFEAYNDFGNNIYIDSINIAGFNSVPRNAAMKSISGPLPALCVQGYTPVITFGNAGLDTIHSLTIKYKLDNGPEDSVAWLGSLANCSEASLTLPGGTAGIGTHVLTVRTVNPNGAADQAPVNDTLSYTFSVYGPAATPIFEGFEGLAANNFPRSNWGIQNVDGGTSFEKSNPVTDKARTGDYSLVIKNSDSRNANNALDYFISPIVQNSSSFDSVFVDFDMAYKTGLQYPGSTVFALDTLEILASSDCGNSFTSVWKKWGDQLLTTGTNYTYDGPFTPTEAAQWKKIKIYLTPFVGAANFQLYFAMKGNRQNSLWLDNINISSQILPQKLKDQGYLIYPNPFNNTFLIHHSAVQPPVDLKALQVFNAAGQLVWNRRYNGNAERQITVDLKNLASGMYILKMLYTNKTVVERIVKN